MKKIGKSVVLVSALMAAGYGANVAQAAEFGRVISSTPVVQQVSVPRQVCTTTTVQTMQPTGGGALVGALIGGALGNQFGRGQGRAVATAVGAIGGGFVGNQIEAQNYGSYPVTQNAQQCHTVNAVENRTVAYNVLYEYAGQRYTVQMPQQPGNRIALQVSTVGSNYYAQPIGVQVLAQPVYQPAVQPVVQPVYYAPPVQTVTYVRPGYAPGYGYNHWPHRDARDHHDRDWR